MAGSNADGTGTKPRTTRKLAGEHLQWYYDVMGVYIDRVDLPNCCLDFLILHLTSNCANKVQ